MEGPPEYRELEHTADVGFELEATSETGAFEAAALAMFDLMVELDGVRPREVRTIRATGTTGDRENLLIRWLTELLYLYEADRFAVGAVTVTSLGAREIAASVTGEPIDPARHTLRSEIKAATYHDLELSERGGRWRVRVIFDT